MTLPILAFLILLVVALTPALFLLAVVLTQQTAAAVPIRVALQTATQLDVDSIVVDLEDSVTLNNKDTARRTVSEAQQTLNFEESARLIDHMRKTYELKRSFN